MTEPKPEYNIESPIIIRETDFVSYDDDSVVKATWRLYSDGNGEYYANLSDVLDFTEDTKEVIKEVCNFHEYKRKDTEQGGYVYLLRADNGLYKIGKARNIDARIKQLGLVLPYELEIIGAIKSLNYSAVEEHLHKCFDGKRIRGEWFKLAQDDVNSFLNLMEAILSTDLLSTHWPKENEE